MITLRPYQEEAQKAVFNEWQTGNGKTLLVLPTGCGKTIVFAKITEKCVSQGDRVLILAHRGELLEQAADKIFKDIQANRYSYDGLLKIKESIKSLL